MDPSKKLLLYAFLLLSTLSTPVSGFQADESEFLLEIGKLLGNALRGENAEPPAAPMAAQMIGGQPGAAPSEKEREEFKGRIQACSNAMQVWVIKSCELPDEQQVRLKAVFEEVTSLHVEDFANNRKLNQRNEYLPSTLPVSFTTGENAISTRFADTVVKKLKTDVLTAEQSGRLAAALTERQTFQHQAFVNFLVSLIDAELFLDSSQRALLTKQMSETQPGINSPLYSFQPQTYYMPYGSLAAVFSQAKGKDLLEATQRKRLQDLSSSNSNGQQIVFQASSGVEEWHKQLNELSLQQREQFLRAAEVRVTWYRRELHLSAEQAENLSNAGKGATVRALGDWKETTQQTFDQMEQQMAQMGGNFGFGAQGIDTRSIDQNEIWAEAVKSITQGESADHLKARADEDQRAMACSILALFDAELWLLPEQRTLLMPMFVESMPEDSSPTRYQEYIRDLILMAHPLFKTTEESRSKVLNEPQRKVWEQLESFFQYQKAQKYVQIQLRNNGGSFGFNLR